MIEDKKDGIKIAESPEEILIKQGIAAAEKRIIEMKLSLELEGVVLKHLKSK